MRKPLLGYNYCREPWGEASTFAEFFFSNLFENVVGSKILLATCIFRTAKKKHLQELYGYAQDHITIIFVANGT